MNIFVYHSLTFGRYLSRAYIYFMSSLKTPNKSHAIHDRMAYFAVFVFTHFCGRTYLKSKTKILPNTWMQNKERGRERKTAHTQRKTKSNHSFTRSQACLHSHQYTMPLAYVVCVSRHFFQSDCVSLKK